jgi:4a-hydroxytetrahydrobiopterin dehydratase
MSASRMTAKRFHEQPGVEDWRVLFWGAYAYYTCTSLQDAAALVQTIADVAAELDHHPDIDVRPEGVTIHTFTRRDGALSEKDAVLAARISETARAGGHTADPTKLLVTGIAVAQDRGADVRPFWRAVLGYEDLGDEDTVDPQRRNPHVWLHELDPPKPGRGRFHIDVSMPPEIAQERVDAALAAGGRLVTHRPGEWWTLASPENHGVDIAVWPDLEDYPG